MSIQVVKGDCVDFAKHFRGLQSIVADPPGGISFMGRQWDSDRGGREEWIRYWAPRFQAGRDATETGAYGLFWALPKTAHWTATALDDAGWEIVDVVVHLFGQGWPKHRDKALKPASEHWILVRNGSGGQLQIDACRVPRGEGVNSSKATKFYGDTSEPYEKGSGRIMQFGGSFPTNLVLSHCPECEPRGTRAVRGSAPASGPTATGSSGSAARGALGGVDSTPSYGETQTVQVFGCLAACKCGGASLSDSGGEPAACPGCGAARTWACPVAEVDRQSGNRPGMSGGGKHKPEYQGGIFGSIDAPHTTYSDQGGASRFFPTFHYYGKCPSAERHAGCEGLLWAVDKTNPFGFRRIDVAEHAALKAAEAAALADGRRVRLAAEGNVHPTVKRLSLGEWCCRLVTPAGGTTGDLTAGSWSLPIAAHRAGFQAHGMELAPEAIAIGEARAAHWLREEQQLVIHAVKAPPSPKAEPVASRQIDLFASIAGAR